MSGALKKTMIYLGLADDEEFEPRAESRTVSAEAAPRRDAAADRDRRAEHEDAVDEDRSSARRPEGQRSEDRRADERQGEDRRADERRGSSRASGLGATEADVESGGERSRSARRDEAADADYRAPVTPIKRASASATEGAPVRTLTTVHPRSYNDAKSIGEAFRSGMPVIMNVTELGDNEAKRLVDFSAGLVFGLHGSITRITSKVFLLTPATVEVMGDGADSGTDAGAPYAQD